ncbi:MAG TPA: hypothetical protein VN370_14775 [Desulfitobacteriaceae bacterium]|nr:hypothetical protein [Desulfitobacteriaceae bacterium]
MTAGNFKYHHIGIPIKESIHGEVYLPEYKLFHCDYKDSEFGIEWMRYEDDCQLPEIVKNLPHIAFEVEDIFEVIKDRKVIIQPNSPSKGVIVAFIEENGAPIELIQNNKIYPSDSIKSSNACRIVCLSRCGY